GHEPDGGIDASGPAPHPEQEVHRDEHQLPEEVEEEEIRRQERAQHPGLEDEQESEELLHPPRDVAPRGEDDDRHQEGGEENEEEAHAVDPEAVLDAPLRNPPRALDELEVGLARLEALEHPAAEGERHEREDE